MRRDKLKSKDDADDLMQDEYFFYIAGYTPSGVPFGITWEEAYEQELVEEDSEKNDIDLDDLPF